MPPPFGSFFFSLFFSCFAAGATRVSASLDEDAAEKMKAREALIGSAGMEKLLQMVGGRDEVSRRACGSSVSGKMIQEEEKAPREREMAR